MRTMPARGAFLLAALVALAGCTASHQPPTTASTSSTHATSTSASTTESPTHGPPPPQNATYPHTIRLSECTGWDAFGEVPTAPSTPALPQGWAAPPAGITFSFSGNECHRISVGPYERGPIHLVLESFGLGTVPDGCVPHNATASLSVDALHALWVDDDQVAAFLKQEFPGLPVYAADIQTSNTTTGALSSHDWSWGEHGKPASTLHVLDEGNRRPLDVVVGFRFFWFPSASDATFLDFIEQGRDPASTNRPVYGMLQPPTIYSATAPDYAGPGDWFDQGDAAGSFQAFGDLACKQPR